MTITTDRDKLRLKIGDTDTAAALFTDDELDLLLSEQANVDLAAADACDILATRFARDFDFASDGQSFKKGSRSAMYAARAKMLREQAGGVSVIVTTRADGYSDDLDSREADGLPAGGRNRFDYGDNDGPD